MTKQQIREEVIGEIEEWVKGMAENMALGVIPEECASVLFGLTLKLAELKDNLGEKK